MKRILLLITVLCAGMVSAAAVGPEVLIPRPVSYTLGSGEARISVPLKTVVGGKKFRAMVRDLPEYSAKEAYRLTIATGRITIEAATEAGAFRARQSLEYMKAAAGDTGTLSCCEIFDYPRFRHRGLMFDISRHFRSKEFILKQIDLMARLKMNVLHLHLTDDAGWRIQIDKYPLLTSYAAWRDKESWKEWHEGGDNYASEGSAGAYGGYLSKDDIRQIVSYASERFITVIPEIELPGHSKEVLAAYPQLACISEDGSAPVMSSDLCPGNDLTVTMFQDILEEVTELFPSEFIHIGGDEADKHSWRNCPRCKARMEAEGLSGVDELQSWLIRHFDKFLASKGRRLLGWDEIMQGGLAPGATVMSWRGTEQGIEASAAGHDVIMTPGNWCYINRNQDNPLVDGELVGGYLPLSRVYAYNPSDGFAPSDEAHLLGLQGNLWTEHVPTEENFEYKVYPRAFAIAEIGWTPQALRDSFEDFHSRALVLEDCIRKDGFTPFDLRKEVGERPESFRLAEHLARGCEVVYNQPFSSKYPAEGEASLTNGVQGGWTYVGGRWQGFEFCDIDVTVDLGTKRDISFVGAHFLCNKDAWIGLPSKIEVWVGDTEDNLTLSREVMCQVKPADSGAIYVFLGDIVRATGRYIRFRAINSRRPQEDWLFTDELIVL